MLDVSKITDRIQSIETGHDTKQHYHRQHAGPIPPELVLSRFQHPRTAKERNTGNADQGTGENPTTHLSPSKRNSGPIHIRSTQRTPFLEIRVDQE